MKKIFLSMGMLPVFLWITLSGCASRGYVDEQINRALTADIGDVNAKISAVRDGVQKNRESISLLKIKMQEQQELLEKKTALWDDALERANSGNHLAKGRLMFEVTISDESIPFAFNQSELSEDAKAELDILAEVLVQENKNVYIEIQGHTDNIGGPEYNLKLGQSRADAVRTYLYTQHGIPLHRMDSFSYGKSRPAVPNDTLSNRAKNRRVVLMVME